MVFKMYVKSYFYTGKLFNAVCSLVYILISSKYTQKLNLFGSVIEFQLLLNRLLVFFHRFISKRNVFVINLVLYFNLVFL